MPFTHYAFSDDSGHQDGRYNSLAMVSIKRSDHGDLVGELNGLLTKSSISKEFKWQRLRNAKYRFAAEKIINFTFDHSDKMRVDVIIWDMEDRRHAGLQGRDDSENLVRMYYHLTSNTLSKRWPITKVCWKWLPDKQSSVCWDTLRDCLGTKKHKCTADLFDENPDFEQVELKAIEPSESENHPLIQVADLFAGMGAYSFGHYDQFKTWESQNEDQLSIFELSEMNFSNSENERFSIIDKVNKMAKEQKLSIGLEKTKGFRSFKPDCFINFWPYVPQHDLDKAPRK